MKAVIFLALAAGAFALSFQSDPFWVAYKQQFNKAYSADEEANHYAIFKKNMARAAELNEIDTARYGWNKFTDVERHRVPLEIPAYIRRTDIQEADGLPESLDWREKGAVTEVKDQEQCGSCWAFCTVVACEGAYFLEHKTLLSLSEQEIVDCDDNDHGCDGGWPSDAMDWIKSHGGLMLEEDYPYTGEEGTCKFDASKAKMQVKSVHTFASNNMKKMMTAVQQYGPLAIALDASKFDYYSSGIMNGSGCYAGSPDHGVAVVGWGEEDGTKYWIVKNSWGEDWGENGYVRILRGENACGVEDYPMGVVAK
jgi:C1A family cysteine protease